MNKIINWLRGKSALVKFATTHNIGDHLTHIDRYTVIDTTKQQVVAEGLSEQEKNQFVNKYLPKHLDSTLVVILNRRSVEYVGRLKSC